MRIILSTVCILITSCTDLFEYSPFDTNVKSRGINQINADRITKEMQGISDTLKFVVFSDTHENYDDMSDAIADINGLQDIDFVFCGGDVAHNGLSQEFEWYNDIAKESRHPIITLIGNHDNLAHGRVIYERLFGPSNYMFVAGRFKFILFNNTIWENNNRSPEYDWLENQLSDSSYYNIITSHLAPVTYDIGGLHRRIYNEIVDSTNTLLAIHGSAHRYFEYDYNGVHTLISTSINYREYYIITLINRQINIDRIKF